ncbi:allophanate hydrolase [Pararhizobium capsulatum DSM 1112]|uniref:Allophanate hydrolase n=1 Tax=Pararhizobium capsulatum DSM 1112 TaxID=1121113 RepID=A0ABU0BKN7_9HYPH|nr:allophanate hydrolase [Pararhizobium capsulatum]MDQ0318294.1 allophanate hydrolase [Pararhizobium capsulatum DSM 1112]
MSNSQAFDIGSLHAAYAGGWPVSEMIDLVLSRIEQAADPGIFIEVAERQALLNEVTTLGSFDPVAKPLWGIPFAVKDNIDVAGLPTTAACPDYAYLPQKDAAVVRLLREAGAIVIGKTNLDQFATGLVGVRTPYSIPRNAVDPNLVPGGSSSGSAVATARGIVSFSLGTDTAGSGRIPAGLNNIVGLKPSVGALSTTGVVPACRTLDCVSIFALTVDDAWSVFEIAAKPDPEDAYSRDFGMNATPLRPVLTIGVPAKEDRQFFGDEAMTAAYAQALHALASLGHRLVEIPFDDFYATANLLYEGAWVAERYAAVKDFFDSHPQSFHPVTHRIYGAATTLTAVDAFRGFYALQALKRKLAPVIASVDLFCVPTAPCHYTVAELDAEPIRENSRLGTYTNFVNLLDMCGIAVPTGKRKDGLPASVTLLASSGKDALVADVARALHRGSDLSLGATGWRLPARKQSPEAAAPSGLIDLVVVGAHLSGLPLNHQLQTLKACFVRAAKTAPSYRLYALPGQTPPKPGLVRVTEDEGASIDVEVWQLTPEAFGNFVAAIPAPLGIGTVALSDGTSCKGFLVESVALSGASDITAYGGWRRYLKSA